MRYYVVDNQGTVHADGDSKTWAEATLQQILEDHPEYKDLDLEIITDADEEETGKYYVVEITRGDEFHTGPFDTPQEAVKEANKAWDHLTSWEKKKTQIEVRQYVADIEADDCTDFDYDTIEWKTEG